MVSRPVAVALVLAAMLLSAGCLSTGPGDAQHTPNGSTAGPTPERTSTPTGTAITTETATPFDWVAASNEPDPSKRVYVENRWDEPVTIDVRVVRNATGETVHDDSHDVDPDDRRSVYDTSAADPEGIETFTVFASARNDTAHVSIETNVCHGSATVSISDDGELGPYYAIC